MKPRCYLFMDIDGVCNSLRSCMAFGGFRKLDDVAIGLIDRLVTELRIAEFDPATVISSTWRIGRPLSFFQENMPGWNVIGATPDFSDCNPQRRGREIAAWLEDHHAPDVPPFVIIDDDSDMLPEQTLIHTDHVVGLQVEHVEQAFEALTGKPLDLLQGHRRGGHRSAA